MFKLGKIMSKLLGGDSKLSALEREILEGVKAQIDDIDVVSLWDRQTQEINKVQRLPEGVEVNFYRIKSGAPSFDAELAFPNRTEELQIARVEMRIENSDQRLLAKVWAVNGFLFSIEYEGSKNYFEEMAALETAHMAIDVRLLADLSQST